MSARLLALVLMFNVLPLMFIGCEDSSQIVDLRTNGGSNTGSDDGEKEDQDDGEDSDDSDEKPQSKETKTPKPSNDVNNSSKANVKVTNNEEMAKLKTIDVYSYNLGLDASIPCYDSRKNWSQDHLVNDLKKYTDNDKLFFIGLQEVWSKENYNAIKKEANELGFKVYPEEHLANSGIVTITNAYVTESRWKGFKEDTESLARGVLQVDIKIADQSVSLTNTDTAYSNQENVNETHKGQLKEIFQTLTSQENNSHLVVGSFYAGPKIRYKDQDWDPIEVLWQKVILNSITNLSLDSPFSKETITWDKENNLTTTESPMAMLNMDDSMLDNIFFTKGVFESSSPAVIKDIAKGACEYKGEFQFNNASDHYGLKSTFTYTAEEKEETN